MNKSFKFVVFLIIGIILIVSMYLGIKLLNNDNNQEEGIYDDKASTIIYNENDKEDIVEYLNLKQLPVDYSIEQAIIDKCFVISDKIYNEEILNNFVLGINEKKKVNLRVVEMMNTGNIGIIDLTYSGDVLICSEDYSRNGASGILINEYDLSEKYVFKYDDEKLNDGTEIMIYFIENLIDKEEILPLFAYQKDRFSNAEYLPNRFVATVESIEHDFMIIEPIEGSVESKVSDKIFIDLDDGQFNDVAIMVGEEIVVTYTGEITKIAEMYKIDKIISIEK